MRWKCKILVDCKRDHVILGHYLRSARKYKGGHGGQTFIQITQFSLLRHFSYLHKDVVNILIKARQGECIIALYSQVYKSSSEKSCRQTRGKKIWRSMITQPRFFKASGKTWHQDSRRTTLIKNIAQKFLITPMFWWYWNVFPQVAPERFSIFSGAGALQQGSKKNFGAG